jgi:hypothetical protein
MEVTCALSLFEAMSCVVRQPGMGFDEWI